MSVNQGAMPADRDIGMDYLKGYACMMMIMGHFPVFDKSDQVAINIQYVISYATMLFFGINGINAITQAAKYSLKYSFFLNLGLFVFGVSYGTIVHFNLYDRFVFEILQTIAVGSLLVTLVYKLFGYNGWLFALCAFFLAALKYFFDFFVPDFHGGGILLASADYVPHVTLKPGEPKVFPGFPLLPWLFIFFWGGVVYRLTQTQQLMLAVALITIFVVGTYFDVLGDWREKWDMSLSYLLLSMIYFSLHFYIIRATSEIWLKKQSAIMLFGRQSLAFLYIHGVGLLVAFLLVKVVGQYVAWMCAGLTTYFGLKLLERWRGFRFFEHLNVWVLLAVVTVSLPALGLYNQAIIPFVIFIQFAIGVLYSKHFGDYRNIVKKY